MDNNLLDKIKAASGSYAPEVAAIIDYMSDGEPFYQDTLKHTVKLRLQIECAARDMRVPTSAIQDLLAYFEDGIPYFQYLPSEFGYTLKMGDRFSELTHEGKFFMSCAYGLAQWPARLILEKIDKQSGTSMVSAIDRLIGFTQDIDYQVLVIAEKFAECGSIDAYFDWQYGPNSQTTSRSFVKNSAKQWRTFLRAPEVV